MSARSKILLAFGIALAAAGLLASVDTASIPGFYRIEDSVAIGGQPTAEQIPTLAAAGYQTIICLRQESEYDAAPVSLAARQAGLAYVRVPISAKEPADAAVDEFLRVTDDPGIYPVYIHCGSGNRAAALWMIRRVLREGWTIGVAAAEADAVGLKSETMRDFAIAYVQRHIVVRAARTN